MIEPRKNDRVEVRIVEGQWLAAVVDHVNEGSPPSFIVRATGEAFTRSVGLEDLREATR